MKLSEIKTLVANHSSGAKVIVRDGKYVVRHSESIRNLDFGVEILAQKMRNAGFKGKPSVFTGRKGRVVAYWAEFTIDELPQVQP
jgi:hypothetical protein